MFEFKMIGNNTLKCWHMSGGQIVIHVTIVDDRILDMHSENGPISKFINQYSTLKFTYWRTHLLQGEHVPKTT